MLSVLAEAVQSRNNGGPCMCLGWGKGRMHKVICSGSRLKYLCLSIAQREDGSSCLHRASVMSNTLLPNQCTQRENAELLKHIKIRKAAPTCFSLQGNHHQGASQYLAKITHLVHADTWRSYRRCQCYGCII